MTRIDYVLYGFELDVAEKEILNKWFSENQQWMEANYKVFHQGSEHEVRTGGLIAPRTDHMLCNEEGNMLKEFRMREEGRNYRGIGVLLTKYSDATTFSFMVEDLAPGKLEEKLAPHLDLIAKIFGPAFVKKQRRIIIDSYDSV